jgi:hypothetical protein
VGWLDVQGGGEGGIEKNIILVGVNASRSILLRFMSPQGNFDACSEDERVYNSINKSVLFDFLHNNLPTCICFLIFTSCRIIGAPTRHIFEIQTWNVLKEGRWWANMSNMVEKTSVLELKHTEHVVMVERTSGQAKCRPSVLA